MTFISYAQNFEDITLWRAFRLSVEKGFYIDVGANDPIVDSVTKAFYDRGWRGVNIEPSPLYYERLCAARAHDVNLQAAVSDRGDELIFFDTGETGLSTVDSAIAAGLRQAGRHVVERVIPSLTLDAICEQYVASDIHFLKIDVEGHEHAVLRSINFQKWRPWILLIENPFNVEPEWADLLIQARYHYVHYDGINRYYLAEERMHLAGAFDIPPSFLDGFRLCYGHALSHPISELEMQLAHERNRADIAEAKLQALEGNVWSCARYLLQMPKKVLRRLMAK